MSRAESDNATPPSIQEVSAADIYILQIKALGPSSDFRQMRWCAVNYYQAAKRVELKSGGRRKRKKKKVSQSAARDPHIDFSVIDITCLETLLYQPHFAIHLHLG
jgi:hypothetical protein